MVARVLWTLIGIAVLASVLARGWRSESRPAVGYVEPRPGAWDVVVAVDDDAERELSSHAVIGNDDSIAQMLNNGRAFRCPPKTKVQVAGQGIRSTGVRVLEGRQRGRSGVLPAENV